jgi:hypothetical protein
MADPLATVATYWNLEDCAVDRTALDAAAIRNFADDYFLVNIDWMYANAMRGIKLRVPREDLERAGEVLGGATEIGEPDTYVEEPAERCESCGSSEIVPARKWLAFAGGSAALMGAAIAVGEAMSAFLVILGAFFITLMAPRRRCTECGERW